MPTPMRDVCSHRADLVWIVISDLSLYLKYIYIFYIYIKNIIARSRTCRNGPSFVLWQNLGTQCQETLPCTWLCKDNSTGAGVEDFLGLAFLGE